MIVENYKNSPMWELSSHLAIFVNGSVDEGGLDMLKLFTLRTVEMATGE